MIQIPSDAEIAIALSLVAPLAAAVLIGVVTLTLVVDWWRPRS